LKKSPGIPALALLLAASAVFSQPVYKSTMPDGKIVYGEKPVTGARKVDTIDPPPSQTGTTTITPQEKARAQQMAKPQIAAPPTSPERAREDAQQALKQAEAAREAGKEPLPGERLGLKGGGSRLTDEYHARQKALEAAVEAARKRATTTK
jgi:hypothetical protein